jgi:hypothetical protein
MVRNLSGAYRIISIVHVQMPAQPCTLSNNCLCPFIQFKLNIPPNALHILGSPISDYVKSGGRIVLNYWSAINADGMKYESTCLVTNGSTQYRSHKLVLAIPYWLGMIFMNWF